MLNLNHVINPLIRVMRPETNTYALQEAIEEYFEENQMPSYNGELVAPSVHITGLSREHATALNQYLKQRPDTNLGFEVRQGYFVDAMLDDHYWIQANHLLIDITIHQFSRYPQIPEEIAANLSQCAYFICDNPHDPLYQLYLERIA